METRRSLDYSGESADGDLLEALKPITVEAPEKAVIASIRETIVDDFLQPGDFLPPERDLANRFCVSRGVVRKALQQLQDLGVLVKYPQSGTCLDAGTKDEIVMALDSLLASPSERIAMIADLQEVLEEKALEILASLPTKAAGALKTTVEKEFAAIRDDSDENFTELEISFHGVFIGMLESALLSSLFLQVKRELRSFFLFANAKYPERKMRVYGLHRRIIDNIDKHDIDEIRNSLEEERSMMRTIMKEYDNHS